MPKLLHQLLSRCYRNPEPGEDGGSAATPPAAAPAADLEAVASTPELLEEHGMSEAEWKALPAREQHALATDTSDSDDLTLKDMQDAEAAAAAGTPPPPPPPPAPPPAPTAPPTATPAPTAAPAATPAAQAPAATPPAPTMAPAAAPAQTWHAVIDESIALPLPEAAIPAAPKPSVTKEQIAARDTAQTALDTLEDKFAEGEITKEEYQAQRKPLRETIGRVDASVAADTARQTMYRDAVDESFGSSVRASLDIAAKAGLDYRAPENAAKLQELDVRVAQLAQSAINLFPGKPGWWYDRWGLDRAHQELAAKYGVTLPTASTPPPPPAGAPAAKAAPGAGSRAAPDLNALPPTLRGAPSAADPAIAGGEFSHLANLTGRDLELAVARMTPDQHDRYLGL